MSAGFKEFRRGSKLRPDYSMKDGGMILEQHSVFLYRSAEKRLYIPKEGESSQRKGEAMFGPEVMVEPRK